MKKIPLAIFPNELFLVACNFKFTKEEKKHEMGLDTLGTNFSRK